MFERYTEKARRVIFFARYEASHYGSNEIDTEHLLLGLLRENKGLYRWLPRTNLETIRRRIDDHLPRKPSISTAIDLPLSSAGKLVLKRAADEANLLEHRHIGTEHLFWDCSTRNIPLPPNSCERPEPTPPASATN
jgi:ATP-dependent Clp protease ATP-binding subunit ClpC